MIWVMGIWVATGRKRSRHLINRCIGPRPVCYLPNTIPVLRYVRRPEAVLLTGQHRAGPRLGAMTNGEIGGMSGITWPCWLIQPWKGSVPLRREPLTLGSLLQERGIQRAIVGNGVWVHHIRLAYPINRVLIIFSAYNCQTGRPIPLYPRSPLGK